MSVHVCVCVEGGQVLTKADHSSHCTYVHTCTYVRTCTVCTYLCSLCLTICGPLSVDVTKFLLVADKSALKMISLDVDTPVHTHIPITGTHNFNSVDYDPIDDTIYWADLPAAKILKVPRKVGVVMVCDLVGVISDHVGVVSDIVGVVSDHVGVVSDIVGVVSDIVGVVIGLFRCGQ